MSKIERCRDIQLLLKNDLGYPDTKYLMKLSETELNWLWMDIARVSKNK